MNEMRVNLFRSFRTAFDIAAHTAQLYKQPNDQQTSQQPNPTQPNPPLTSQPNSQAGKQSASHPCYPLLAMSSSNLPQNGRQQVKPESKCRNLRRFVGDATSFASWTKTTMLTSPCRIQFASSLPPCTFQVPILFTFQTSFKLQMIRNGMFIHFRSSILSLFLLCILHFYFFNYLELEV